MLISSNVLNGINGTPKIPGDKSISHRSIIIPSIAKGITEITNITNEMIKDGDEIISVLNNFKKYINLHEKKIIYLIGHNSIHFDILTRLRGKHRLLSDLTS